MMDTAFKLVGLSCEFCVGICTDGAPSMVNCLKGFVVYDKRLNENISLTHCCIHREVLVVKTIGLD
jgi:hypothetical protein